MHSHPMVMTSPQDPMTQYNGKTQKTTQAWNPKLKPKAIANMRTKMKKTRMKTMNHHPKMEITHHKLSNSEIYARR